MTTPAVKVGPFGATGGTSKAVQQPKSLVRLEIWNKGGSDGYIHAIRFTYKNQADREIQTGIWGSQDGDKITINMTPGEYVTELSGTSNESCITSLRLKTNKKHSQTCGNHASHKGHFSIPVVDGAIVAFFGSSDNYLNSIGAYVANHKH